MRFRLSVIDNSHNSDGLVIVTAQLHDADVRDEFWHHIESLIGERVNEYTFEFSTSDWDDGLWDDELAWLTEFLDGTGESIIIWRFADGCHNRYVLGNA